MYLFESIPEHRESKADWPSLRKAPKAAVREILPLIIENACVIDLRI